MTAIQSIIDYVKGERDWVSIHFASCDLERLGKAAPEAWPKLTFDEWRTAIEGAIASGMLRTNGTEVRLPEVKAAKKEMTQGSLFDL
jgi:hypothetical protein